MIAHLIGGTCEFFRHFYGLRRFTKGKDRPFGADPLPIPDLLALVGDAADGYPGIPGIGAKTGGVEWGRV